jgi:signal transduction histidine kinase/DNA-binding response OmpR family regulator
MPTMEGEGDMSPSLSRSVDPLEAAQVLDDLTRDSLRLLLPVTVALVWAWAGFVALFVERLITFAYAALLLAVGTGLISYRLHRWHPMLAAEVYLLGLVGVVMVITLCLQDRSAYYLYMPVVLIAAMLTNPRVTWGTALLSVAAALAAEGRRGAWSWEMASPLALIGLTALASWLSARRLFTALAWMFSMTREAQRKAEEARQHRAELQRVLKSLDEAYVRLERANEALIFAREAAEKAYRFKAEFVANVSHELRTPLNLIVGFSEMMATAPESYGGVPLPREYRGDVMAIYRSARHLSDLINDVLDLSRIEAGRLPLAKEPTDLAEVVREAIEMVRGLAEARGLRLELELPESLPLLHFDRTRIRQVLLNLLTNATRFTDRGWIRVRARLDQGEVLITVEDSGRGIPPDRLAKAFEAFSQLDEEHIQEGSGLGLAVSKKFVELHGGRMWIESELGRGTTVGFSLPIPQEGPEVPLSSLRMTARPRAPHEQPVVLVLHDDPRSIPLLRRYVDGYEFVLADTRELGCEAIEKLSPVAVIMDTAWAVRWGSSPPLTLPPHVPVITCPLPSMRRLGLLLGAADYLPKPVTREELWSALSRLARPVRTVLIVDDDPHVVRLLARMLKAGDPSLRVLEAFGGEEGLAVARTQRPEVILLDLLMPQMNGYAFLEELTRDPEMACTSVIIVSVRGVEQETAPMVGELRLEKAMGFSLTEVLQALQAMLFAVTRPAAILPASAAVWSATPSG